MDSKIKHLENFSALSSRLSPLLPRPWQIRSKFYSFCGLLSCCVAWVGMEHLQNYFFVDCFIPTYFFVNVVALLSAALS